MLETASKQVETVTSYCWEKGEGPTVWEQLSEHTPATAYSLSKFELTEFSDGDVISKMFGWKLTKTGKPRNSYPQMILSSEVEAEMLAEHKGA